jgi:hypothetical protein
MLSLVSGQFKNYALLMHAVVVVPLLDIVNKDIVHTFQVLRLAVFFKAMWGL